MKQLLIITGSFLLLCLVINCIVLPSLPSARAEAPQTGVPYAAEEKASVVQNEQKFRLGIYDGMVSAFRSGEDKPFYTSQTKVSDLPEADRAALAEGISVDTRKELNRMMEDFCS